jgi:hypothetical protein
MRLRRAATISLTLAAVTATPAVAVHRPPPPPCEQLAFSPTFAHDRTMFCAYDKPGDGAYLARSLDAGRTWQPGRAISHGSAKHFTPAAQPSPWYPTDHRILATTHQGLFESTDSGITFHQVQDDAQGYAPYAPRITGYLDTLPNPASAPHGAYVYAVNSGVARVYDPILGARHVLGPITASAARFLVPPDYSQTRKAVVLAAPPVALYQGDTPVVDGGLGAYTCAGDFTCPARSFYFGDVALTYSAPLARPGSLVVLTRDNPHAAPGVTVHAWRTSDYGQSWLAWPSLDGILSAVPSGTASAASITAAADKPNRLYLHLTTWTDGRDPLTADDDPAAFGLYRSDNDGRTWQRIASSSSSAPGSLPWNFRQWWAPITLSAVAGGRLYATATHRSHGRIDYTGAFCSADAGRTWRRGGC